MFTRRSEELCKVDIIRENQKLINFCSIVPKIIKNV